MLAGKKIVVLSDPATLDGFKSIIEATDKLKNTSFFFAVTAFDVEAIIKKESPDLLFLDICCIDIKNMETENVWDCEGTKVLKRYGRTYKTMTISYSNADGAPSRVLGSKWNFMRPTNFDKIIETWELF